MNTARAEAGTAARLARAFQFLAAPAFALLAIHALATDPAARTGWCSARGAWPADHGMVLMYLAMTVFHLPPWLVRLADARRPAVA